MTYWVNGQATDTLALCDRGLAYGDGFFTTMSVYQGKILNWPKHWQRLVLSCKALSFPDLKVSDVQHQLQIALKTVATIDWSVIKLTVTRGCGGIGYMPPALEKTEVNIIVQSLPFPKSEPISVENDQAWPFFTVKAQLCQTLWGAHPQLAGIKHLNRLENVLARQELRAGMSEGLMLDMQQQVISGTQSNVCLIQGNSIITPVLATAGVHGTVRATLQEWLSSMGWQWVERTFDLAFLQQADEVFFCNAVRGIMPMNALDGQDWPINQATKLQQVFIHYMLEQAAGF